MSNKHINLVSQSVGQQAPADVDDHLHSRSTILRANPPQRNVMTRGLKEILNLFRHEEKVRV